MPDKPTLVDVPDHHRWRQLVHTVAGDVALGDSAEDVATVAVNNMTTDDDVALHELWDSCPDPDRYAHYDYESPGAEMQSVVLGNLFAMIGVTDASGRSRSMDDADLSTLAVAQRTPPPVVAGDPLLGDVTLDLQEFFAEHIDGERPVANAVRLSGQKVRVTLEDGRRFDVTVSRVV